MTYSIYNLTKERVILDNVKIADTFTSRLKGLLGKKDLSEGEGLVIRPCNSIHTIGMKFPIDVAFIDKDNNVLYIMNDISKGKLSPVVKNAKYVIEAGAGEFEGRLSVGDRIKISEQHLNT